MVTNRRFILKTSCVRGDTICPRPSAPRGRPSPHAPPRRRNVAVLSHAEYVTMLTAAAALRIKAALSKAAWWPWFDLLTLKVVSESLWRGLSLCQLWSS